MPSAHSTRTPTLPENRPTVARNYTCPLTRGTVNSADQRTTLRAASRDNRPETTRAGVIQPDAPTKKKHMRANINVATLNMNGLTAPSSGMTFLEKWSMVNQTLNKNKIAVLALQETHLDQEIVDRLMQCFGRKMHIEFSQDPEAPRTKAGVAFVINKTLIAPSAIKTHVLHPGRALALKINWLETEATNFLNIYAPVNRSAHRTFWSEIEKTRLDCDLPRPDFLLGDFNVTEDPIDRAPAKTDDQPATDKLRDVRLNWDVQDAWRAAHPDEKVFTYRANANGNEIKSRLDRIYVANRLTTFTFDWVITPSPVPTDHWLVAVKYAPKEAPEIGKGRWTLPLHLLKNNKFTEKVIARGIRLQDAIENPKCDSPERHGESPQLLWERFKEDIQEIAKELLAEIHYRINSRIVRLEKDRAELANDPEANNIDNVRTSEAMIAREIAHLEGKRAKRKKDKLSTELALHGEKLGGIWSAMIKERKPKDLIRRLRIPDTLPPQYERNSERMADLARKYHDDLQSKDLPRDQPDHETRIDLILSEIPDDQTLKQSDASAMDHPTTETQTEVALHLSKNGSATGMDGCPYELWKTLKDKHERASDARKPSFNIIKVLTIVLQDIQLNGVDEMTQFALGWLCPIYKKKDKSDISNYRPITLLNTDYKILTKVLALQLRDHVTSLVHTDQAGFIPKRSIFHHIRLANAIIDFAEATEVDGAIVALDQEKAYDKVRHDYLWDTLHAFNLPNTFINTVKTLYRNATTQVVINGFLSDPYKVTRGIRQGDPLSCTLFDLAIEPLACMVRKEPNFKGITLPDMGPPLKAKFFADDTSVYMSKGDTFDLVRMLLDDWCAVSGAKFNIGKTEVIPIGSEEHRKRVVQTRKINQHDAGCLNEQIKIAEDGNTIRFLGAWIGNQTKDAAPWEPVVDRVNKRLEKWATSYPTMRGRKLIVQSVVGGLTQFLTMAQGMPTNIEVALTKIIRGFMWGADSSPRLALSSLQCPEDEGGLNLLDITARNEAIELMWLKSYLDLSPARPPWATVTDALIDLSAPPATIPSARGNNFLQTWKPATRGQRASLMGKDSARMLKVARKYNLNLEALRLTPQLRAQLPAWYHIAAPPRPITGITAKCLINTHQNTTVAHLLKTSMRLRNPNANPQVPHLPRMFCYCHDCSEDRTKGCRNPHACATEAQTRLEQILPKFNPLSPGLAHGNLSLTKRRKRRNAIAKPLNGVILFDPAITSKEDLSECFRIFTDPKRISNNPARRLEPRDTRLRLQEVSVYTDGACINNGKDDAKCGGGVWFGPNHNMNRALRIPGRAQSNQIGELGAVIAAIDAVPINQPLKIITDSRYVIDGLTDNLRQWEDKGWIGIQNAELFKRAAFLLRRRTARTSFQWVKGHSEDLGNEESDKLAKQGAEKNEPDTLDLSIPIEFDLQGAKLATLTQSEAYRGIRERQKTPYRASTATNLKLAKRALHEYNGEIETDASIWKSTRNPVIRTKIRQFLFRMMHQTPKVGGFWSKVPKWEHRQMCAPCQKVESLEHILVECNTGERRIIWQLTEQIWPHEHIPFPEISFGIILGCGAISPPAPPTSDDVTSPRKKNRGARRLLQILISEAAHLIWVLRCERVIQGTEHSNPEIEKRWLSIINKRLIDDKITATIIRRTITHIRLTRATWEAILMKAGDLPDKWMTNEEVLVGRRF